MFTFSIPLWLIWFIIGYLCGAGTIVLFALWLTKRSKK